MQAALYTVIINSSFHCFSRSRLLCLKTHRTKEESSPLMLTQLLKALQGFPPEEQHLTTGAEDSCNPHTSTQLTCTLPKWHNYYYYCYLYGWLQFKRRRILLASLWTQGNNAQWHLLVCSFQPCETTLILDFNQKNHPRDYEETAISSPDFSF